MANSVDIFKELCDGLLKDLRSSTLRNEMWLAITYARCQCADRLLAENYTEQTRDKCIAMYTESINVILVHPEAIALIPEVKTLFQTFHKKLKNQINPFVFDSTLDGDAFKTWVESNINTVNNIANRLPDPPHVSPVICGESTFRGGVIGLLAMSMLDGVIPNSFLIPVVTMCMGSCSAYYKNNQKLQRFESECLNQASGFQHLQVIEYRRQTTNIEEEKVRYRSAHSTDKQLFSMV